MLKTYFPDHDNCSQNMAQPAPVDEEMGEKNRIY